MKSESDPLTAAPKNAHEEKMLRIMATEETRSFVPSHASVVRWYDMLPLHYVVLQIFMLQLLAFSLKRDVVVLSFIYIALSLPMMIYAIHRVGTLENLVFELRFVLPHKRSYTSVIVNTSLIPTYRFWLRVQLSLIEAYCLIIAVAIFI